MKNRVKESREVEADRIQQKAEARDDDVMMKET